MLIPFELHVQIKAMGLIHDRMLVILNKSDEDMWLHADEEQYINAIFQPLLDNSLFMHGPSRI